MSHDFRLALRQIRRAPLFSGVVIAVIALGIGINAGMLTLLDRYAWRPAPGVAADKALARLANRQQHRRSFNYAELRELRAKRDVFAEIAAWSPTSVAVDFGGGAEAVYTSYTTDNFFRALGVRMAAGTGFPEVGDRGEAPIAVIGHSVWMTYYNGSSDAVGRTIRVAGRSFTIIGVTPPRFIGPDVAPLGRAAIWIPIGARRLLEPDVASRADSIFYGAVARLAPGVAPRDVERRGIGVRAERLTGMRSEDSGTRELVAAFFIVAALIVVITCTNVSALLLGRAVARRREIGVRLSLGATRLRLIRQLLTESLVHAAAGAVLALLLYAGTMKIAYAIVPEIIPGLELQPMTFFFAAAFALVTTLAFGLAPALHATKTDIAEVIKSGGAHAIRRSRLQSLFIVVQLASSQPVLVVTSLVLANMRSSASNAAPQAPASVMTMESQLLRPREDSFPKSLIRAMQQRLQSLPGVQSAALSVSSNSASVETGGVAMSINRVYVTPNYFSTLGVPIVRGRSIGADQDHPGSVVVVVNQAAAERLWPGIDPVGKRLILHAGDTTEKTVTLDVIGVAGRPAYDAEQESPRMYAPMSVAPAAWMTSIAVRTAGEARAALPQLRAAMRDVEPNATIDNTLTLAERYAATKREAVLSNWAALIVGAAALVLASLGLYAIIAFSVSQRGHEIGVRMAMGATPGAVVRQFFRTGLRLSAVSLVIGLPAAVAGIRVVQASVVGFTLQNVAAIGVVVPVLIGVAALASWLPARRAGRVDPLIALRSE